MSHVDPDRPFRSVLFTCINKVKVGLGALTVEQSFFHENERNDQERSHRSKKKERSELVLKNFGTISKRTERNETGIA